MAFLLAALSRLVLRVKRLLLKFLHTIPGLDTSDPNKASIEQEYSAASGKRMLQFLSPVSLVLSKLMPCDISVKRSARMSYICDSACKRASNTF